VFTAGCAGGVMALDVNTTSSVMTFTFSLIYNTNGLSETETNNTFVLHSGSSSGSQSLTQTGSGSSTGVMTFFACDAANKIVSGTIGLDDDSLTCDTTATPRS
jgi:hypothetical protein